MNNDSLTYRHRRETLNPLSQAVIGKNVQRVRELLSEGSDPNKPQTTQWPPWDVTPLMYAADVGSEEILALLIDSGANVNARDRVIGDTTKSSVLHYAAIRGNTSCVKILLERKTKINSKNSHWETPLMVAAGEGRVEVMRVLLAAGADPSIATRWGHTLMHAAITNENIAVLEIALRYINPNAKDVSGDTPLHSVMFKAHRWPDAARAVRLMCLAGADVNLSGHRGFTPLVIAAMTDSILAVEMIHEAGADLNLPGTDGKTALDIAIERKYKQLSAYLRERGATGHQPSC